MRANFEDRAAAASACFRHTKTRIKKTGVVHPEFAYQGIVRQHLRSLIRRYCNGFAGCQDIKIIRVECYASSGSRKNRIPKFPDIVMIDLIDINYRSMFSSFIPDKTTSPRSFYIDTDRQPAFDQLSADRLTGGNDPEAHLFVQPAQCGIA